VVTAASGQPIPGALVLLDSGQRTFADPDGRFVLAGVRPGPYRIAAVTPGCHVGLGNVAMPAAGRTIRVRLAVELPGDTVPGRGRWALGERSEGTSMRVVTAEDIRARNIQSIQDAIRLVAPEMVGQVTGEAGSRQALQGRGRTTVTGPTTPLIIVDGVRLATRPLDALAVMSPLDVERIEVSKGPAGGWRYGLQAANGVIRIFTRKPGATFTADMPPDRCAFRFPR